MKILSIKKGKKNSYIITFETEKKSVVYDDLVVKYSLLPNKSITETELKKIEKEQLELEAYYKGIQYLTIRMRTKKEMIGYLKKCKFDHVIINKAIEKITNEGYLKEEDYISAFLNDAFRFQNDGPMKLKQKLIKEDLNEDLIKNGLEMIEKEDWLQKLKKLMQKKANAKHNDSLQKYQQKCMIYFYNLGYPKEWILELMPTIIWTDDDSVIKRECEKLYQKWSRKFDGEALDFQVKKKLYEKGFPKEKIDVVIKESGRK